MNTFERNFQSANALLSALANHEASLDMLHRISAACIQAIHAGGKILTAGNGGSAADAQHFAAELVGRYKLNRRAVPAIALTTDTSALTAIGNDFGFDDVFARQVEALVQEGDVLLLFSTSGNSMNLLNASTAAKRCSCTTVAFLGKGGGALAQHVDLAWVVPSDDTARIQEAHQVAFHALCEAIEAAL